MGQILQDGENVCFMSIFFKKYSLHVTKTDKIYLIVQLFLAQWVLGTLETPFPAFGKISGVPCSTSALALFSHFWVKNRALVRQNLQV